MRRRASSITSSVWTQTSPSGCHSGSCGQPTSAFSSGKSRSMTPSSSASAKPSDGRSARSSSFSISPQMRSAGRSSSGMRAADLFRVRHPSRARSARRTECRGARAGCRLRRSADRRRAARGARADRAGRRTDRDTSSVSGSQAIALTVKSRRRAASSGAMSGSPLTSNARWPRPIFDSRRGSDTSTSRTL